jgi:transcriptional regulator with XRE-family HTH domain
VSRQAISKWENAQNYPSIEIIIKISDLFGLTVDELLRSDEALKKKVINDSKQLAHPKLKFLLDVAFLIGFALMVVKFVVFLLNRFTDLEVNLLGGSFLWNVAIFILLIGAGMGSNILKEKYKEE